MKIHFYFVQQDAIAEKEWPYPVPRKGETVAFLGDLEWQIVDDVVWKTCGCPPLICIEIDDDISDEDDALNGIVRNPGCPHQLVESVK